MAGVAPAPGPYRALFLDAGGTLIHLDRHYVIGCLRRHGVAVDEPRFREAEREAVRRIREQLRTGPPGTDASRWRTAWAEVLAELGCSPAVADSVSQAVRARHAEGQLWTLVEPGTAEALAALRDSGYRLGVVSNADGRVERYLEHAGLRRYLDFVVDSAIVGVEKPDPRIFAIACERAGVEPHEAVHVGDIYEIDVLGARAAGVDAVLVSGYGGPDPEELDCPRIGAVFELPDWLNGGGAARRAASG